jgi:hypothetical protein
VAVSAALAGLAANTTYHFRIVASNAGGTSRGTDRLLTTLSNPPTAVSEPASSVTQTSATLNATVNPNGGTVTACTFEYGPTASYGMSASCPSLPGSGESPVAVSASIARLAANATYHFRIVASNSGGTGYGADRTVTALPNAPTVVTGNATEVAGSAATLNALVDPNGASVTDCDFEYGTAAGHGSSVPCKSLPGSGTGPVAVFASVAGLTPRTGYYFHIVATSAGGRSEGAAETFTTSTKPVALTGAAVWVTQSSATLSASVNSNGTALSGCHFDYGSSTTYGESAPCAPMPGSATSPVEVLASIGGLAPGTPYHFRIVATNSDGTSAGADQIFTTQPIASQERPPAPQPLPSGVQPAALTGVTQAPAQYQPARPVPPVPTLLNGALTVNSSGLVRVILACPSGGKACAGAVTLRVTTDRPQRAAGHARSHGRGGKASLVPIASGRYAIPAGRTTSVTLAVSSRGRRMLAASHSLRGQAALLAEDLTGASLTTAVPVTLTTKATRSQPRAH